MGDIIPEYPGDIMSEWVGDFVGIRTLTTAELDADPRWVPNDQVRAWLRELAKGNFIAPPTGSE